MKRKIVHAAYWIIIAAFWYGAAVMFTSRQIVVPVTVTSYIPSGTLLVTTRYGTTTLPIDSLATVVFRNGEKRTVSGVAKLDGCYEPIPGFPESGPCSGKATISYCKLYPFVIFVWYVECDGEPAWYHRIIKDIHE